MIGETRLMPDLDGMAAAVSEAYGELLEEARRAIGPSSESPKIEGGRGRKADAQPADAATQNG